jgi:immune inhibitor A
VPSSASAADLVLTNSFVSSTGWVKPGDRYPFTLRVRNPAGAAVDGGTVTVPAPAGTTFSDPAGDAASVAGGTLTW